MLQKKTLLFVYDFPHSKSIDFLYQCIKENIQIDVIIAAGYTKIKKTKRILNFHKYTTTTEHPKDVASQFNIPYFNCEHNSLETKNIINEFGINFGIIAGARILNQEIIRQFFFGILNLHPGLLPHSRGLDSILWSIYNSKKIGVSAHLINEKIDAGQLVLQKTVEPLESDSIFDIYRKVYKVQIDLLPEAFNLIDNNIHFEDLSANNYYSYMPEEIQKKTLKNLKSYIANYSKIK